MKKTFFKTGLVLAALIFATAGFTGCSEAEEAGATGGTTENEDKKSGTESGVIKITNASTLAQALACDVSDFVYEEGVSHRAAIAADQQEKNEIDTIKMIKTGITMSSGYQILNVISSFSNDIEFDKEFSVTLTEETIPEILNVMFETTKLSKDYFISVFNGAKITMSKVAGKENEYEIIFKYSMYMSDDKGNMNKVDVVSYIYVIGTTSGNLTIYFLDPSVFERTVKTIKNGESTIEMLMYEENGAFEYLKAGNKNSKNYYEKVRGAPEAIETYAQFNQNKGVYWTVLNASGESAGFTEIFGLSETKPALICTNYKIDSESEDGIVPDDMYFNTYYLKDKNADTVYDYNYNEFFHAADDGFSIDFENATNPLYYLTADKNFYGVKGSENLLTDEAKAVYIEMTAALTAAKTTAKEGKTVDSAVYSSLMTKYASLCSAE